MTRDEALKLALEALENHCGNYKLDEAGCERWNKAVAAIKEALAQQEQEPVAHVYLFDHEGRPRIAFDNAKGIKIGDKLYTTPAQRPWVGLTAQEAADCWTTSATKTWHNFEAALRSKNI